MRDADVRIAVRRRLEAEHAETTDTLIVDEMGVWSGTVRIDLAVINGEICGYELKSDRDTLARLPVQADVYSRVFDRVTLVVGERHASKAREIIPKWWGVVLARYRGGELQLVDDRKSKRNPKRDPHLVAELLTKDEAISILERHGLAAGWRSKRAREIYHRLATELPLDRLSECVRVTLRCRQNWLGNNCPRVLDVTVDAVSDPLGETAWLGGSCGNLVDDTVSPTMCDRSAWGVADDALRMPTQLNVHVQSPCASGADASADQKC